jgi:hypothetical protein
MRCLTFISVLVLISCYSSAQTQKGKFLIEAGSNLSLTFANSSYDSGNGQQQKSNSTQFAIQFGLGYFLFNNFAFGVEPMFTYYTNKDISSGSKLTSTSYTVGPMVRYYIGTSKVKPLVQANAGWTFGDSKFALLNSETKTTGLKYGGGVGVGIFISQSISLNGILDYQYTTTKTTDSNSNKTTQNIGAFDFIAGFTIFL